jgi:hypothetical protein
VSQLETGCSIGADTLYEPVDPRKHFVVREAGECPIAARYLPGAAVSYLAVATVAACAEQVTPETCSKYEEVVYVE